MSETATKMALEIEEIPSAIDRLLRHAEAEISGGA